MPYSWTPADRAQLRSLGIPEAEADRQLEHYLHPPAPARLVRPCAPGDGIDRILPAEEDELLAAHAAAAAKGRCTKFVPASGAASRMFRTLLGMNGDPGLTDPAALRRRSKNGDAGARDVLRLVADWRRFAFADALADRLRAAGVTEEDVRHGPGIPRLLEVLLGGDGLGLPEVPKGLIPFHAYPDGPRTAFEEHWSEGIATVRDAAGHVRLHFTVPEDARGEFERLLAQRRAKWESDGTRLVVEFSIQDRSTDTPAVDPQNRPFRLDDGSLLFRPGGHGSLLRNLERLRGDLVFVKNIDNIVPEHRRAPTLRWKRLLAGRLVALQTRIHAVLRRLDAGDRADALFTEGAALAALFEGGAFDDGRDPAAFLRQRLDRPLRVCGVVPNEGEPGGGPFWVVDGEGRTGRQIVESSQVDFDDPGQAAVWRASTHFNPVDLVCGVRDHHGEPHRLDEFVDEETVFIATKSEGGRELKALERPGLWNGAMAYWNTLFVEVPIETFAPVKTLFDLLRPQHQPPEG